MQGVAGSRRGEKATRSVPVEPVEPFGNHLQKCFTRRVAVGFVRQRHIAHGRAVSLEHLYNRSDWIGNVPELSSASPCINRIGSLIWCANQNGDIFA